MHTILHELATTKCAQEDLLNVALVVVGGRQAARLDASPSKSIQAVERALAKYTTPLDIQIVRWNKMHPEYEPLIVDMNVRGMRKLVEQVVQEGDDNDNSDAMGKVLGYPCAFPPSTSNNLEAYPRVSVVCMVVTGAHTYDERTVFSFFCQGKNLMKLGFPTALKLARKAGKMLRGKEYKNGRETHRIVGFGVTLSNV